ncbi:hypothetical protein [Bradyrhizobium sp. CCH5-F6]|uniref:hypothetical protein n=1 Tax=Bradyrhizobium sp. CCH5-F6 TaxID=1768753 RepID=UPI000A7F35B3|nr:hypothetical protein [Bradyrhizobium sp. CCH5-F6]
MRIIASIARDARVQKNTCCIVFSCNRISLERRCCEDSLSSLAQLMQCVCVALDKRTRLAPSTLL